MTGFLKKKLIITEGRQVVSKVRLLENVCKKKHDKMQMGTHIRLNARRKMHSSLKSILPMNNKDSRICLKSKYKMH